MILKDHFSEHLQADFLSLLLAPISHLCRTCLSPLGWDWELPLPCQGPVHAPKVPLIYKLSP